MSHEREGEEIGYEVKDCLCDEPADIQMRFIGSVRHYWVECSRGYCWRGPAAKEKSDAVHKWNARSA